MTGRQMTLSITAALLFVCSLGFMMLVTPTVRDGQYTVPPTTEDTVQTTYPTTQPAATLPPDTTLPPNEDGTAAISTPYSFVYSSKEKRTLFLGGDADALISPASLTKLLTAKVAADHMDMDTVLTVGEEITWIDPDSSVAWLAEGHRLSVHMLLQALLLPSGNDAAYTLAVGTGRVLAGDPELDGERACAKFVEEMNRQADELGMQDSHFVNPDGNTADGHKTTVRDLITLSKALLEYPQILKICGQHSVDVTFESGESCTWVNSNMLLYDESPYYMENAIGMKTGSTEDAGKCLISLFEIDGGYLAVGVMGCADDEARYRDTLYLYHCYA